MTSWIAGQVHNMTISGTSNQILTSTGTAWAACGVNAAASSVIFDILSTPVTTNAVIGLTTVSTPSTAADTVTPLFITPHNYAAYLSSAGTINYNYTDASGNSSASTGSTYTVGDTIEVKQVGTTYYIELNGSVIDTRTLTLTGTLYTGVSAYPNIGLEFTSSAPPAAAGTRLPPPPIVVHF